LKRLLEKVMDTVIQVSGAERGFLILKDEDLDVTPIPARSRCASRRPRARPNLRVKCRATSTASRFKDAPRQDLGPDRPRT